MRKIGAVVIADADDVHGILPEWDDIVRSIADSGGDVLGHRVSQVMTSNIVTCGREATLDDVMDLMTGGRFRYLPVASSAV